jgi:hypothetical protein
MLMQYSLLQYSLLLQPLSHDEMCDCQHWGALSAPLAGTAIANACCICIRHIRIFCFALLREHVSILLTV